MAAKQQLKGEPFTRTLKTVVIKAQTKYYAAGYGANECGDYVCPWGFLNCPADLLDPGDRPPIKGQSYKVHGLPYKVIYQGCQVNNITGIYTAREFYGMDSTGLTDLIEKKYLSTLLWKPIVITSGTAKNTANFYTSDSQGTYKITIEGVAANGELLNGEKIFTIEQKPINY